MWLHSRKMASSHSAGPDLFHQGKSAGSEFLDADIFGSDHFEGFVDEQNAQAAGSGSKNHLSLDRTHVEFAGSNMDCLHVFDTDCFHGFLDRAWHSLEPKSAIKLPWESGIWEHIFGPANRATNVSVPKFVRPSVVPQPVSVPVQQPPLKSRRVATEPQSWQQVVMASDVATWQEIHDAKMDTALKRWFDVAIMFPTNYQLVSQLAALATVGEQMKMMKDVIGSRSPLTLLKRVNSITRYMTFLRTRKLTAPGSESDFYSFLNEQRAEGAPQSRLAAVVESVRFMEHVLGLEGVTDLLSKRCLGAARQPTAGPQLQASPLKVAELSALHEVLGDVDANSWDRNMAGSFLCCVYTRSRWSDFQHSNVLEADPNQFCPEFVELSITDFKTKTANAWRGGLLAAVAPAVGVTSDNWASAWMAVREALQAPLDEGFPVMPAPDMAGTPTKRPITTREVTGWIRLLLQRSGLSLGERRISSHSAKSTMLSFLAKYGAELPVREILGAHVSHLQSVIRYSRDALAEPLRVMNRMLADVRSGTFVPDATRSGYFKASDVVATVPPGVPVVDISDDEEVKVETHEPTQDETEEEPDTGSSSDEEAVDSARCSRHVVVPKAPDGYKLFQHTKSRMLHLMALEHNRVFQCGRMAGEKHEISRSDKLRWDTPCCGRCWRAAAQSLGPRFA